MDQSVSAEMLSQLKDIVTSMADAKPQVRLEATKILGTVAASLPLTVFRKLELVAALKARLSDHPAIAHAACVTLINSCAELPNLLIDLTKHNIISNIMEALQDPKCEIREILILLLSNISCDQLVASQLCQEHTELEGLFIMRLISLFIKNPGDNKSDPCQFIVNILVNISQLRVGRELLMNPKRSLLRSLLPFVACANPIRKLGVLKTVRNCCYDRHRHGYLVSPELGLIEQLVTPIIGPEPIPIEDCVGMLPTIVAKLTPAAQRDPLLEVRKLCVEIVFLLVVNREERTYLRDIKLYPLLRELHKVETDEEFQHQIEDCVQFFVLDEAPDPNFKKAAREAAQKFAEEDASKASAAAASDAKQAEKEQEQKKKVDRDEDGDEIPNLIPSGKYSSNYTTAEINAPTSSSSSPSSSSSSAVASSSSASSSEIEADALDAKFATLLDD